MRPMTKISVSLLRSPWVVAACAFFMLIGWTAPCPAQLVVGAINGTVLDPSGAAVEDAVVKAHNVGTNLDVEAHTGSAGSYSIPNLPVGTYTVTFSKTGFDFPDG